MSPADSPSAIVNPGHWHKHITIHGLSHIQLSSHRQLPSSATLLQTGDYYSVLPIHTLPILDTCPKTVSTPTFISAKLDSECKQQLTDLLKEYKDCFAWDYTEMPSLDRRSLNIGYLSNLDFGHINSQLVDVILIFFMILRPK